MEQYTTLYLVRHGETEWNAKGIVQGQSESVLTKKGKWQAQYLTDTLKEISFDAIFSSDLSRATQTAEIINLERKLVINTNKLLREGNWGKYEGKPRAAYKEENKEALERLEYLTDQEKWKFKVADDIESDEEIVSRFITILREIAVTYKGKIILVVTHGGLIRTLLIHLAWAQYGQLRGGSVKNAGYVKLESDGIEFIVKEVSGVSKN